jgi:hypothetical protein
MLNLELMAENGTIGLMIYLLMYVSLLYYLLQTRLDDKVFLLSLLLVPMVSAIDIAQTLFSVQIRPKKYALLTISTSISTPKHWCITRIFWLWRNGDCSRNDDWFYCTIIFYEPA